MRPLPSLRRLTLSGCRLHQLTEWPERLRTSLTWLYVDSYPWLDWRSYTNPPTGCSWSQLSELRHLGLRCAYHSGVWGYWPEEYEGDPLLRLDLASLPPNLQSLGCTGLRLGSTTGATMGSVLGTLSRHITTLSLDGCAVDGEDDVFFHTYFASVLPGLPSLWHLRDLRLVNREDWLAPRLRDALVGLHQLTRLYLEGMPVQLAVLPPIGRHLSCNELDVAWAAPDAAWGSAPPLRHLTMLELSGCRLLLSGAGPLLTAAPALQQLRLSRCSMECMVVPREPRGWEVDVVRHHVVPSPRLAQPTNDYNSDTDGLDIFITLDPLRLTRQHLAVLGGCQQVWRTAQLPQAGCHTPSLFASSCTELVEHEDNDGFAELRQYTLSGSLLDWLLGSPSHKDCSDADTAFWASGRYSLARYCGTSPTAATLPWAST